MDVACLFPPLRRTALTFITIRSRYQLPPRTTTPQVHHFHQKIFRKVPLEIVPHCVEKEPHPFEHEQPRLGPNGEPLSPEMLPLINEDIPSHTVQLVDDEGKIMPPIPLRRALRTVDRSTSFLAMMSPPDKPGFPVCKILNIGAEIARAKERRKESRARDKFKMPKQIELNWAISRNDLEHRLSQLRKFLQKGHKVEVVLASKRKGRMATIEEGEEVLKLVHNAVKEVEGATAVQDMDGQLLGQAILTFQGRDGISSSDTPVQHGATPS